jgi:hypothetical protein
MHRTETAAIIGVYAHTVKVNAATQTRFRGTGTPDGSQFKSTLLFAFSGATDMR